jgi:hypothetical protein
MPTPEQQRAAYGDGKCDCERSHNGLGIVGRKCDCPEGTPHMTPEQEALREKVGNRFWNKVSRPNDTACWEWTGCKGTAGYGSFAVDGKTVRAHRMAYQLAFGEIPAGMLICHKCDNPPCCNPRHLFAGTSSDNVRDAVQKGRHVRPDRDEDAVNHVRGERSHLAKLGPSDVLAIRERSRKGERFVPLAAEYNVDRTLIGMIVRRQIWKHI